VPVRSTKLAVWPNCKFGTPDNVSGSDGFCGSARHAGKPRRTQRRHREPRRFGRDSAALRVSSVSSAFIR